MQKGLHIPLRALMLSGVLSLAACREMPKDYVEIAGKLFVFNVRIAEANYVVTLRKLKPIPEGSRLEAIFEDPAGGPDLVVRQNIWPQNHTVSLESPALSCIAKARPYRIEIRLRDTSNTVLQEIKTTLASELDQTTLPDRPLVVGPGYDPNPALQGRGDGKLPNQRRGPCPA
jgi:hypothetical protein